MCGYIYYVVRGASPMGTNITVEGYFISEKSIVSYGI
jgi:hypothetical protein